MTTPQRRPATRPLLCSGHQVPPRPLPRRLDLPDRFLALFGKHAALVSGQVGLTTVDEGIARSPEPQAPAPAERLRCLQQLVAVGVNVSARADPLVHGLTDTDASALFAAIAATGVKSVSASYLFLRPAICQGLARSIADPRQVARIPEPYRQSERLALGAAGSAMDALPLTVRRSGFERLRALAHAEGLHLLVCGCKNPDLTNGRCQLTRDLRSAKDRQTALERTCHGGSLGSPDTMLPAGRESSG